MNYFSNYVKKTIIYYLSKFITNLYERNQNFKSFVEKYSKLDSSSYRHDKIYVPFSVTEKNDVTSMLTKGIQAISIY